MLDYEFRVDVVYGERAELLKYAFTEKQRCLLALHHRSVHIMQDCITDSNLLQGYDRTF